MLPQCFGCRSTRDEHVILTVSGSTVGCWAYKTGDWHVLHNFKATVMCMQQSASQTQLLAVGTADAMLHIYDVLLQKVCTDTHEAGMAPKHWCNQDSCVIEPAEQQQCLLAPCKAAAGILLICTKQKPS
jgi:hypothetical protein